MKPYTIKKSYLAISLFFLIYPFGSLPLIIWMMIRRERYGFILFGVFMGLVGLLVPPTGDFYRYTQDAELIKGLNWQDFLFFSSLKFDFLLIYLSYLLSLLNINFDLSRFIYNSISYILLGLLYLKLVNSNTNIKKNDWIFLVIFITFSFSTFLYRFYFSMVLFLYGSYDIILYKKKIGWVFIILSVLNHISFIIFFLGFLFKKFNILRFNRKVVLILCLLAFMMDSGVLIYIMNMMPMSIIDRFMIYLDGYWASDFLEDHSVRYKIMLLIGSCTVYFGIIIYYFIYKFINKKNIGLSNFILFTVALTSPFAIINGRFLQVFFYNVKVLFLKYYKNNTLFKKCKMVLLILTIVSTVTGIWSNRRQWNLGDGYLIFYSSFPSIITHTYSPQWINTHVYENGDFVK